MPILTALDEFRLELGDHPTPGMPEGEYVYLFNDDECAYWIAKRPGSLLLAVADACDSLAASFARAVDFDANEQKSFKLSQKSKQYAAMAKRLRERAATEGNDDGTGGGVPTFSFPAPHDWQTDLAGVATTIDPVTDWPL